MFARRVSGLVVALLVLVLCTVTVPTHAVVIDSANGLELDIEYTAGSGPFESFLVIDFAETGGDAFAFSYLHDGTKTSFDMLNDVSAAGGLVFDVQFFDFGTGPLPFVNNFSFGGQTGNPDFFTGGGWRLELGTLNDPTVDWTSAGVGVAERLLTDGSFDGWYNTFSNDNDPRVPLRPIGSGAGAAAVPEPTSTVLCLIGVGALLRRRRV